MKYTKGKWDVTTHGLSYPIKCGEYTVAKGIFRKANANLISAAPDMYEALKSANNLLNGYTSANDNEQLKQAIKQALAKAEGRIQ